jgi:hypothetical protein
VSSWVRASPTTPTTVAHLSWFQKLSIPPPVIFRPMGSRPGQAARAKAWLTTAAWGASASSRASNRRPSTRGMPRVRKYPPSATR